MNDQSNQQSNSQANSGANQSAKSGSADKANGSHLHSETVGEEGEVTMLHDDSSVEIQKLQEDLEKSRNDLLYLRAEFDNYKRNAIKERSDLKKFGAEYLIRDLLNVVDNFERALQVKVTPENLKTYSQGVEMTSAELKAILQKHGVSEVPTQNAPFDPAVHEALGAEVSTEIAAGHILRVHSKAFKLHDKVIRPAQVIVAKASEG